MKKLKKKFSYPFITILILIIAVSTLSAFTDAIIISQDTNISDTKVFLHSNSNNVGIIDTLRNDHLAIRWLVINPSGGNVGIGKNPDFITKLDVNGTLRVNNGDDAFIRLYSEGNIGVINVQDSSYATGRWLKLNPSGGNVAIGNIVPQAKLHVGGDFRVDGQIFPGNSTGELIINGVVKAVNGYSCSDIRYKKDIAPVTNALEKLSLLKGVYYNWKTAEFKNKGFSDKRDMGFIAQDLEKVFPEVVYTGKDGYKSIAYSKLTAVIVEALKAEHKLTRNNIQETASVKQQLASMQKENAQLKKQIASLQKMSEKVAQLENAMKMYMVGVK